jgi:hypothetical protein
MKVGDTTGAFGKRMTRIAAHVRYLLVVALISVVLPCLVIALTTSSFYYRHSSVFWDPVDEHQFGVHDQKADILLIGDSSLLFGVSPELIRRETGWDVYNLGVSMPVLMLGHEMLLRRYLSHNKTPRLMILYLSAPMRTRPPYAVVPTWYEGETMLLRYGGAHRVVDFFVNHGSEISRFISLAGHRTLALDWSGQHYNALATALDSDHGHVEVPFQGTMGDGDCPVSPVPVMPDEEFIQQFRREAARLGIPAAVYLAPLPDCDPMFAHTSSSYSRVVDNAPYTLAHRLFADDHQRVHLVPAGARQNSHIVAAFLDRFTTVSPAGAQAP